MEGNQTNNELNRRNELFVICDCVDPKYVVYLPKKYVEKKDHRLQSL